ncbi:hypothetical protein VNO80_06987 [Phaseolus coccineus]|uniref:Uncharacterized protein n=1 Tax=Phaseolus coccineus TaxID=3886 RepID=A0AAN9NIR0_PHACN
MHVERDSLKSHVEILKFSLTKSLVHDHTFEGTGFVNINTNNDHMCHVYIKCEKQRRRFGHTALCSMLSCIVLGCAFFVGCDMCLARVGVWLVGPRAVWKWPGRCA